MSKASSLVADAKAWAKNYGPYPNGPHGAVLSVPLRLRAAWDRNDAAGVAEVFVENGSMLVGDRQLMSCEEIQAYFADAFSGDSSGTRLDESPVEISFITDDVAVAITDGGVLAPGETEVPGERRQRSVYVVVKRDGDWQLASYQASPLVG